MHAYLANLFDSARASKDSLDAAYRSGAIDHSSYSMGLNALFAKLNMIEALYACIR